MGDTFFYQQWCNRLYYSPSPSYVFLSNCILCDVSLATKTLNLLAAPLLTKTSESGIEIPSGKQSASGVKAIGILWSDMPRFTLQFTLIILLAGTFILFLI